MTAKVPVTVLTGFLGSGKTTLLNRILTENHGQRIAIIENEFGEIGIDHELVVNVDEEIVEMNNGCICCTVRGDLIRIINRLLQRRDKFDRILIETTGMADPGPVAQTFFVDPELKAKLTLDGIITLVDAKHLQQQWGRDPEVEAQVAFADVLVLNKCDLVDEAELKALEGRLASVNGLAKLLRATNAAVPLEEVLSVGGFDLDRALELKPSFLEPEYPFEWAGLHAAPVGLSQLHLAAGPDDTIDLALYAADGVGEAEYEVLLERALVDFTQDTRPWAGEALVADGVPYQVPVGPEGVVLPVAAMEAKALLLVSQHGPEEFEMRWLDAEGQAVEATVARHFAPDHTHDEGVTSVGLRVEGAVDPQRMNAWLNALVATQGTHLYRFKGVVNVTGEDHRMVFHGVHMLIDAAVGRPWGEDHRVSQLIFIGRELDRAALQAGFASCLN